MRYSRILSPAAALLLIVFSANAQTKIELTVDRAIALGLDNSKSLHASLMNVQTADSRAREVSAQRLPSLRLSGSYTRLSDVPPASFMIPANTFGPGFPSQTITSVLSPTILDNYSTRLTLQQPLFTGFRLQNSVKAAEYTADAEHQLYNGDRAALIHAITTAYWNLYKAREFKTVLDENIEQVKAHLKNVQNLHAQGIVTKNEVLKVEVQLSNVQVMQLDAANNVRLATIALNNQMGIPLSTEIVLADSAQELQSSQVSLDRLVERALEQRPELRAMDFRVKAGEAAVSAARAGWFPQLYLVGNYNYARPNSRIFPTQDRFRDTWDVSVLVSFDVWNWGTTAHQTSQAQAQLSRAKDMQSQFRDGVTLEVTQAFLNVNQSREKIAVAAQGVGQAEENLRITNEQFKAGLALNSDVLDAEVALLQAKWNHVQAIVDHKVAGSALAKAVGETSSK
jgi:outer membrane protein